MSLSHLCKRAEDIERDVGAISMRLQANDDLQRKDFADIAAVAKDCLDEVDTLVTDAEQLYEGLSDRAKDGFSGGQVQEFLGHCEDAEQRLDDAVGYLGTLLTGEGCRPNMEDAVSSLDQTCDCPTSAMKV